ncbi:hypothetical protein NBRC116599_40540 [Aquicoccus sp. SU-CL01552]
MDFCPPDTAIRALATKDTRKRPGHDRPAGFTGGNLRGLCVRSAFWRPKPRLSDPHTPPRFTSRANRKGHPHA